MSLKVFLKEKIVYILMQIIVFTLIISIIWALNPVGGPPLSLLIGGLYIIGAVVPFCVEYIKKRNFYNNLISIFDSLDRKNLIAEIVTSPSFEEGVILYSILKGCNKAMIEEINRYKFMQEEYREYVELWVHEVKTPIASSKLIAQNNRSEAMDSMLEEIERVEEFVEQALFYSRSNNVEKDYIIKEVNLEKMCFDVLRKNSKPFIHNRIGAVTENLDINVFSDEKWIEFILNQIITNSIKYSDKPESQVKIHAVNGINNVILFVEDNGKGILENELSRIFDKGFTGTNGRKNERSTGMGLYICKKLCDKLGLSISTDSVYGKGTTISITFPKNSMMEYR